MSNFDECLKLILHHEGGYVNHPKDPGGETNMGVTKRVYEKWCMENDLQQKDMKDLEFNDVAPIYKENYWDRVKADQLPAGLDLCVFDWAVNSGTGRAAKKLQGMIGTTVDGGIGPNTLKALNAYVQIEGLESTIATYTDIRQNFYESLSTFDTFGKGWTRRNQETEMEAFKMAGVYLPS
jgi:lysozyme family protein|tara:strand:- start:1211 stop:1750 length:540 start_codon:yes stop_codon:yes gene_type:complete